MRSKSTTEGTRGVALCSALGSIAALGLLSACDSTPLNMGAGGAAGVSGSGATVLHTRTNSFTIFPGGSGGMAGSAGASGNAGSGGSSGVSGSSGSPGSSGTSGASGTSGTSGSSGSASSGGSGITQCIPTQPPDPATATPELVSPRMADPNNVPLPSRTIGAGRHPLAAGCNSVGVVFADHTVEPPNLLLSTYYTNGLFRNTTSITQATISTPDPGVAGLPDDSFAVAWTDFGADNDELGILLQKVAANGSPQGEPMVANEGSAFSQSNSDIVFDGSEIVVAWSDSSDASSGPDLRYRLFSPDLTPLTGDVTLANTSAAEDDVVLAGQGGQWAAAWRSGSNGVETIEVQSGATHWTVGPFMPGKTGDRPDLAFLDATHLAVAFTMGTDPNNTGVADTPRLHGAVLDFAFPGQALSFELPPAEDSYAASPSWSQSEPSLVVTPDHLQVAWRAGQLAGDANGTELWSRRYPITLNSDHSVTVDTSHVATPVVQTAAQRAGDQNAFRMLGTNLWPSGGLFAAWDDASHSFGAIAGVPDVALQFLPGFTEPQLPVTTYHLSADGRYYLVNLLKRNYPPISALAVYSGGRFNTVAMGRSALLTGMISRTSGRFHLRTI
ncbi:MAG TPA: hypothetical protein VGI10_21440 [Polyangiaceae bacterium]